MTSSGLKDPINLREHYGELYRIVKDESAYCEEGGRKEPWYFQIPCVFGHLYPFSHSLIAFYCASRIIRNRFHKEHPTIDVRQWADDGESVFLFEPEQFDLVAEYAKPKRKRRVSDDQRQRLVEMGREHRFVSEKHGVQVADSDRHATISISVSEILGPRHETGYRTEARIGVGVRYEDRA